MSSLDVFFDAEKITRTIPCDIQSTPNLRAAARDCRPEIGRVKVDANTSCIRAYTHDEDIVYVFDCSTREGDCANSIAQVVIGLGRHHQSLFGIPECLTDGRIAAGEAYWIELD